MARSGCDNCGKQFSEQRRRRFCPKCRNSVPCTCGRLKAKKSKACKECFRPPRGPESPTYKGGTTIHKAGYVMESAPGRGYVMQHVLVMEDVIGRRLFPGENVHHINGARADNRPENLELWTRPQPSGIRTADAVDHAVETLARYAPHLLR